MGETRYLDIAEVARRSGLPASTLRFYEEKSLIASTGRRGLRRLFHADVIERLTLITVGRAAGFSLDEIALMFTADGRPRIDRKALEAKAKEIDRKIRKLITMRDGLRHAAACRAPSHLECPTFRRIMRSVAAATVRSSSRRRDAVPNGRPVLDDAPARRASRHERRSSR